jgi:hypothetical protein
MRWDEFAAKCPEIAELGEERLRRTELCFIGTLRNDGAPRISPCEPDFVDGELMMSMMWQSRKALDLLRDPRCVVHSCIADRWAPAIEFKLYGRAVDVQDADRRQRYRETIKARIDWEPEEPNFHLFAIEIDSAAYVTFADEHYALAWDEARGLRRHPLA